MSILGRYKPFPIVRQMWSARYGALVANRRRDASLTDLGGIGLFSSDGVSSIGRASEGMMWVRVPPAVFDRFGVKSIQ